MSANFNVKPTDEESIGAGSLIGVRKIEGQRLSGS
jgi:hypothetical protein